MNNFGEYIIYADESGDHNLQKIDPRYPLFVLTFCIFEKESYSKIVTPKIKEFKFKYFGHDAIILHERDIYKANNQFKFLRNPSIRESFMNDLSQIISDLPFTVITSVVNKDLLKKRYMTPDNPYHIALQFCLERTRNFLNDIGEKNKTTHLLIEERGKDKDKDLELEFRRICDRNNHHNETYNFEMTFINKKSNQGGVQIADLLSRPIGVYTLNRDKFYRPFQIIKKKFRSSTSGNINGYGYKLFP